MDTAGLSICIEYVLITLTVHGQLTSVDCFAVWGPSEIIAQEEHETERANRTVVYIILKPMAAEDDNRINVLRRSAVI